MLPATFFVTGNIKAALRQPYTKATIGNMLPATFFSNDGQHFSVMTGNITKKCCRQHVANCCLGVRPPLLKNVAGNMLPIVALV
jgi:hypothetical protein